MKFYTDNFIVNCIFLYGISTLLQPMYCIVVTVLNMFLVLFLISYDQRQTVQWTDADLCGWSNLSVMGLPGLSLQFML